MGFANCRSDRYLKTKCFKKLQIKLTSSGIPLKNSGFWKDFVFWGNKSAKLYWQFWYRILGDRYLPGGIHTVLHICQSIFAPKMMWWYYCYLSCMSKVVKNMYFFLQIISLNGKIEIVIWKQKSQGRLWLYMAFCR